MLWVPCPQPYIWRLNILLRGEWESWWVARPRLGSAWCLQLHGNLQILLRWLKQLHGSPQILLQRLRSSCRHSILHLWFNQGEWLEWLEWPSMYLKNHECIIYINLFLHYMHQLVFALHEFIHSLHIIKMILRFWRLWVCPVSKSDHRIERCCMIKFSWSTCIVSREGRPHMISLN